MKKVLFMLCAISAIGFADAGFTSGVNHQLENTATHMKTGVDINIRAKVEDEPTKLEIRDVSGQHLVESINFDHVLIAGSTDKQTQKALQFVVRAYSSIITDNNTTVDVDELNKYTLTNPTDKSTIQGTLSSTPGTVTADGTNNNIKFMPITVVSTLDNGTVNPGTYSTGKRNMIVILNK